MSARQVTHGNVDISPAWSADGRLAFARLVGSDRLAILGGQVDPPAFAQLVAPTGYSRYPCWSPDGQSLAFATGPTRASLQLATINLSTHAIALAGVQGVAALSWSRQGALAYAGPGTHGDQDIFVIQPMPGGQPHNLTNSPGSVEDFPVWSPDGQRIAFV